MAIIGDAIRKKFFFQKADKVSECIEKALKQIDSLTQNTFQSVNEKALLQQAVAAGHASKLIGAFKISYIDCLDQTVEKTDAAVQRTLTQIEGIINDLAEAANMSKTVERIEFLIRDFPFVKNQPRVFEVTPRCLVSTEADHNIVIELTGQFPEAEEKTAPTLSLQDKQFKPIHHVAKKLAFSVPLSTLFPDRSNAPVSKISLRSFDIEIPFRTEQKGLLTSSSKERRFYFTSYVAILPPCAAAVSVEYTVQHTERVVKEFRAPMIKQSSRPRSREGEDQDIIDRPYRHATENGYTLQNSRLIVHKKKGPASYKLVSENNNEAHWLVTTLKNKDNPKKSGKIEFLPSCTGYQDITTTSKKTEEMQLVWGDKITIIKRSPWKMVVNLCDGTRKEVFNDGALAKSSIHPWIKISPESGTLEVVDPNKIDLGLPNVQAIHAQAKL